MENRIIQLETLITLQDDTIRNLNDEIYRQMKDLTRLADRIEIIEEKLKEVQQGDSIAGNERPPHY